AHTSTVAELSQAVLLTSEIERMGRGDHAAAWDRLLGATYIARTWGDAYGYLLVATGRAEIMLDPVMQIWDCGPFGVILPEAGGTFTDWQGAATIRAGEAVATNGALAAAVQAIIDDR
ncbi:MAG: histidinol phosphate phosphatase, partial [Chloroflexi bacterium]|nr:histidinol phosphate phosphatase [Chloroflexota bacterium]